MSRHKEIEMTDEQKEEIRKLLREELSVQVLRHRTDGDDYRVEIVISLGEEKISSDWIYLPS